MSENRGRTLRVAVAADLGFVLQRWPASALAVTEALLRLYGEDNDSRNPAETAPVIRWRGGEGGDGADFGPELSAPWEWRPHGQLSALAEKLRVRIDARGAGAEIAARGALNEAETREVLYRLLPAVMGELAAYRGWLLIHAAAVGWGGQAMVFPGGSGCGKTTVYSAAAAAGWPALSDDLTWIRPFRGKDRLGRAVGFFLAGGTSRPAEPTIRELPLGLLVFPALGEDGRRQVRRLPATEVLRRVNERCVVLGCPATRATRFGMVSLVAARTPGFAWQRPRFAPPQ